MALGMVCWRLGILRIKLLHNVRRFAGRGVAVEGIGDGVNVLCAVNEFGKSTCFDALHALFFQPHTGTPGAVQALRPYSGGNPLVEADITTANGAFRLTKQFYGGKRAVIGPRPALELGYKMYQAGPLAPDLTGITGEKNPARPQLLVYGDFRTAVAYNDLGAVNTAQAAARLNLDVDLRLTSTERFHAFFRPLDRDGRFTRYEFGGSQRDLIDQGAKGFAVQDVLQAPGGTSPASGRSGVSHVLSPKVVVRLAPRTRRTGAGTMADVPAGPYCIGKP